MSKAPVLRDSTLSDVKNAATEGVLRGVRVESQRSHNERRADVVVNCRPAQVGAENQVGGRIRDRYAVTNPIAGGCPCLAYPPFPRVSNRTGEPG